MSFRLKATARTPTAIGRASPLERCRLATWRRTGLNFSGSTWFLSRIFRKAWETNCPRLHSERARTWFQSDTGATPWAALTKRSACCGMSPESKDDDPFIETSGANPFFCSSLQHWWHASRPSARSIGDASPSCPRTPQRQVRARLFRLTSSGSNPVIAGRYSTPRSAGMCAHPHLKSFTNWQRLAFSPTSET